MYLAFKIRNIRIRGLNDSKQVSIILYVTSVIILVILIVNFVYGDYIDVDGFVYGFGLSTAVTFVLVLTFVPKVCDGVFMDRCSYYLEISFICDCKILSLMQVLYLMLFIHVSIYIYMV